MRIRTAIRTLVGSGPRAGGPSGASLDFAGKKPGFISGVSGSYQSVNHLAPIQVREGWSPHNQLRTERSVAAEPATDLSTRVANVQETLIRCPRYITATFCVARFARSEPFLRFFDPWSSASGTSRSKARGGMAANLP